MFCGRFQHVICSDEARIEGKVMFRRYGATHALDYYKEVPISHQQVKVSPESDPLEKPWQPEKEMPTNLTEVFMNDDRVIHYRQRRMQFNSQAQIREDVDLQPIVNVSSDAKQADEKYSFSLPCGKKKVLHEVKTIGITLRDTKLFGTTDGLLKHHRRTYLIVDFNIWQ